MFGVEFFKNAVLCFSKFSFDSKTLKARLKGTKLTEKQLIQDYTRKFIEIYDVTLLESQFTFLDNAVKLNEEEDCEEHELLKFREARDKIKDFVTQVDPFLCQDIKEVMKENEELKQ